MSEKKPYLVRLPDYIAEEITRRSKALSSNPTEYATNVIKWWFGEGSPPISAEEKRLLEITKGTKEKKARSTPTT
ncbi:hypothetical protein M2447_002600 [Ereboglobus sp. PH5-10]|uniref:hypothetical protein n=1 Tax=Ereboglobus sp. PH5-10 TaxID=2940629 RepID=UPI0024051766|nr:hypothetical protein [Ereboglobus sp. PH5-10]MDF9828478.1 hypothetical protein [Ereboglobus sp. PH5-10]